MSGNGLVTAFSRCGSGFDWRSGRRGDGAGAAGAGSIEIGRMQCARTALGCGAVCSA